MYVNEVHNARRCENGKMIVICLFAVHCVILSTATKSVKTDRFEVLGMGCLPISHAMSANEAR